MKLLFEKSRKGRLQSVFPKLDVAEAQFDPSLLRSSEPRLPQISESDLVRHYTELAKQTFGVCDGFYPLGSCTMKYNPKINEDMASLSGFADIHPLQPEDSVQGSLEVMSMAEKFLSEITGMDHVSLQPAAGAHGEYAGLLLIKKYFSEKGETNRKNIIIPDSAHGTNPASAVMAGFNVVSVSSNDDGGVDLENLKKVVGDDTAGLMLTNPNTLGLFDRNILEITDIVHKAGGLCYYDGANLNAVMGRVRPGDMGFDCVHVNLHKTFSTPHGGGGPGSGPIGCREFLARFLPGPCVKKEDGVYSFFAPDKSIGRVSSFYGNFLVVVRALTYIMILGREGIPEASACAVLNANYLMKKLSEKYDTVCDTGCMHEFVVTMENLKKESGVSAMDIAKRLLDFGIHPPTMYFPLNVHEALMIEPTESESPETLRRAADIFLNVMEEAKNSPEVLKSAPNICAIGRPDEVLAARSPKVRYEFEYKQ